MPNTHHAPTPFDPGTARSLLEDVITELDVLVEDGVAHVRHLCAPTGRVSPASLHTHQHAAHALAWLATTVEALRQLSRWATGLHTAQRMGTTEHLLLSVAAGSYLAQIAGGVPMAAGEMAHLHDLGLAWTPSPAAAQLLRASNTQQTRDALAKALAQAGGHLVHGDSGLDDEMEMIRAQFHRFCQDSVTPHAHQWHLDDALIPLDVCQALADMGVFAMTIPESHGGLGMSKIAMAVVSEELSRGYIGVGSLVTRTDIAAELVLAGGTEAQKAAWLPRLASGEVLPTAVFTEPDTGSDLAHLRTRARREGDGWVLSGNKTWITHAARAHLMAVLARSDASHDDHRGLSLFLVEKTPGTDADPFPDPTLSGGEIPVLGYRGMKEYTLSFDDHPVPEEGLLGGEEGKGFSHLMQTFESARIQTAARAVGVAQSALDTALRYAQDRHQFGQPLLAFPRVSGKIALMAADILVARLLTYASAARKDSGERCDLEAGMAKMLAARTAWWAADNAVQIHGGNGYAMEYPVSRILCDARVLGIFEGASEIQAQVIARRLIEAG